MAIIKMGAIATAISGSIGGTTFAHTKGGTVARAKLRQQKSSSKQHLVIRNLYSRLRSAWRDLTPIQRQAWSTTALARSRANRLGQHTLLSGAALFIQVNSLGAPFFEVGVTPPQYLDPPSFGSDAPQQIENFSVSLAGGYTVEIVPNTLSLNFVMAISAARTFRPYEVKAPSHYRAIAIRDPAINVTDFKAEFIDILGEPVLGEFLFLQTRYYFQGHVLPAPVTHRTFAVA